MPLRKRTSPVVNGDAENDPSDVDRPTDPADAMALAEEAEAEAAEAEALANAARARARAVKLRRQTEATATTPVVAEPAEEGTDESAAAESAPAEGSEDGPGD